MSKEQGLWLRGIGIVYVLLAVVAVILAATALETYARFAWAAIGLLFCVLAVTFYRLQRRATDGRSET